MTRKAPAGTGLRQTTVGGGHQYWLGDEGPFPGVTSILKVGDLGADGLLNWAVKLSLVTAFDALDAGATRDQAVAAAYVARNAARELGSSVHNVVESINVGRPVETTPDTAPFAAQYAGFLVKHHVEVLGAEGMVINRALGYGGSYDLRAIVDGRRALVDVKTGKDGNKPEYRLQLGAYRDAEVTGADGEPGEPMFEVDDLYVLHLRADAFELIPCKYTDADREHFAELARMYHRIKAWNAAPVLEEVAA